MYDLKLIALYQICKLQLHLLRVSIYEPKFLTNLLVLLQRHFSITQAARKYGPVLNIVSKIPSTHLLHSNYLFCYRERDACDGDSGGPLMWRNDQRQWFLNGIVSYGSDLNQTTCRGFSVGIYTKVANYGVFLANNIRPDPLLE